MHLNNKIKYRATLLVKNAVFNNERKEKNGFKKLSSGYCFSLLFNYLSPRYIRRVKLRNSSICRPKNLKKISKLIKKLLAWVLFG